METTGVKKAYEAIEAAIGQQVAEYKTVAGEGLRLQPNLGITLEELEDQVLPTLTQIGWIVTSTKGGVLVEPRYTSEFIIPEGAELYHASDCTNQMAIITQGLMLGRGGNTRLDRKYPPRIFFALGLDAANKFIDFQCQSTKLVLRNGRPARGDPVRSRNEFDIWRITDYEGIEFFKDVLFPGEAAWTETEFPPESIQRVI